MSVPGTCCSPFTQRPLLSNLNGGWSAVVFKCTYQSRNSSTCRFFEALGLKGIGNVDGNKLCKEPPEQLRSRPWTPFLAWFLSDDNLSETTALLPPIPDSLCPDSHCGPRKGGLVLQSRTLTGLRW